MSECTSTSRHTLGAIATLVALLLVAAIGRAQEIEEEKVGLALTGTIVGIDVPARTLRVLGANGETASVRIDGDTTMIRGGKGVRFDDLREGDRVALDADRQDGSWLATYVEIVEDPTPRGERREEDG
jgi:hypothetical protein